MPGESELTRLCTWRDRARPQGTTEAAWSKANAFKEAIEVRVWDRTSDWGALGKGLGLWENRHRGGSIEGEPEDVGTPGT